MSPLKRAIYPAPAQRRAPDRAPGCPAFKRDSVLERPDGGIASASTVSPGLHRIGEGDAAHDVVWWDPGALHLGHRRAVRVAPPGVDCTRTSRPQVIEEGMTALQQPGAAERLAARARGCTPWVSVSTMTEWAAGETGEAPAARGLFRRAGGGGRDDCPTTAERPAGTRFGTLVHAVAGDGAARREPGGAGRCRGDARPHGRRHRRGSVGRGDGRRRRRWIIRCGDARRAERDGPMRHRETARDPMLDGDPLIEGVVDLGLRTGRRDDGGGLQDGPGRRAPLDRLRAAGAGLRRAVGLATGKPARAMLAAGLASDAAAAASSARRASRSRIACSSIARWAGAHANCKSASARDRASSSVVRSDLHASDPRGPAGRGRSAASSC